MTAQPQSQQMTIEQALELAVQHHQAGQAQQAESIYRQILAASPNHPDAMHLLGLLAFQVGRLDVAADLISRAIAVNPAAAHFHSSLGQVFAAAGRFDAAVGSYRQALSLAPGHVELHVNLGSALMKIGQLNEAEEEYRKALSLRPEIPEGHYNLGLALVRLGRFDDAIAAFRQSLSLRPDSADAHNNLGNALLSKDELDDAVSEFNKALALRPDDADAHNNLGSALRQKGLATEAAESYRRALKLRPNYAEAHNNLGCVLQEMKQLDEAMSELHQALTLRPGYAEAHYNLGNVLHDLGRLEEAMTEFESAISMRPDYPDAIVGLGNMLGALGRTEEAIGTYRKAISIAPNHGGAHNNLALTLLSRGDFEEGWQEHEWRWTVEPNKRYRPNFTQPPWDGTDLNGRRILVHAEQGFGDAMQFARYVPMIQQRGGRVILQCQPDLLRLFKALAGVEQFVTRGEALPDFDVHCPFSTLPLAFKTRVETIPAEFPYLRAEGELSSRWRERVPEGVLKVGLVWGARPFPSPGRSVPLSTFAPLGEVGGAWFCSLQKGDPALQARTPPAGLDLTDWTDELHDFTDTAALIDNLDLVISIDTSIIHLAGAMKKPVWVPLLHVPDWRWMLGREDSPWYPTVRLFRQPVRGDWETPIGRIVEELRKFQSS